MHWNPSSPPTHRVRRRVFLAALALFLLPGLCPGEVLANGQSDQDRRIRDIIQNSSATVRDTRGNVIAELKDGVPRQVRSDNFSNTVKDVGTAIRDGQLNLHRDHMNLVYNLQMELGSQPANDTTHNSLRGAGGNADALADWLFFTLPLDND
ncbi:MAG: hypothetical protein ACE5FC_04450, partial [Myxococcota bacterium]